MLKFWKKYVTVDDFDFTVDVLCGVLRQVQADADDSEEKLKKLWSMVHAQQEEIDQLKKHFHKPAVKLVLHLTSITNKNTPMSQSIAVGAKVLAAISGVAADGSDAPVSNVTITNVSSDALGSTPNPDGTDVLIGVKDGQADVTWSATAADGTVLTLTETFVIGAGVPPPPKVATSLKLTITPITA